MSDNTYNCPKCGSKLMKMSESSDKRITSVFRMNFGKYKNYTLPEVLQDKKGREYLDWLLNKSKMDLWSETRAAIELAINNFDTDNKIPISP